MRQHRTYDTVPGTRPARLALGGICAVVLLAAQAPVTKGPAAKESVANGPVTDRPVIKRPVDRVHPTARVINVEQEPAGARGAASGAASGAVSGSAAITAAAGKTARDTIRIAIVDSGIDAGHDELSNRISHVSIIDPRNETGRDHATLLAGIVAQSTTGAVSDTISTAQIGPLGRIEAGGEAGKTHAMSSSGSSLLSPSIDLVDIRASYQGEDDATLFDPTAVAVGIASAAGGAALRDGAITHILDPEAEADIINISIGGGGPENTALIQKAMQQAAKADKILVIAAGNAGKAEPDYPARIILDPQIAGLGLVVVNMMQDNGGAWVLNEQSNKCGETAEYCVGAPGTDIDALLAGGRRGQATGSSLAAAHVSAALARIKAQFPQMSNREVVAHLLAQSENSGGIATTGTGRGLVGAAAGKRAIPAKAP